MVAGFHYIGARVQDHRPQKRNKNLLSIPEKSGVSVRNRGATNGSSVTGGGLTLMRTNGVACGPHSTSKAMPEGPGY